jgi:adhesin HecA-like repeat protein
MYSFFSFIFSLSLKGVQSLDNDAGAGSQASGYWLLAAGSDSVTRLSSSKPVFGLSSGRKVAFRGLARSQKQEASGKRRNL